VSHARGRLLGGIAIAMGLAAACNSGHKTPAQVDAMANAGSDAFPACANPSRMSEPAPSEVDSYPCTCGETAGMQVEVTFDANGNATAVTGVQGQTLPADMAKCFLDLLAPYCYPTLAGKTQMVTTCHAWIA
jgi:hypothetical protein